MLTYLLEKEFKQFFRNSILPKMIIMLPLMATLIFPLIASFEIKNIRLAYIDYDKSSYSSQLIRKIYSSGYFTFSQEYTNSTDAMRSMDDEVTDVILLIPADFEKKIMTQQSAYVNIIANSVNGTKGGFGSMYISSNIVSFSKEIAEQNGSLPKNSPSQIEIEPNYQFNPYLEYRFFMIPALMMMIIAIFSGFLPALNIVGEKESGTIEQINVTPIKRSHFILSKLIPYWVVGFIALTISILIARFVYGLIPAGNVLLIYLSVLLFVIAFSGFGLVVSNYASTMQQAMFMMFFFVLTFIFMSGLYTPIDNMPLWAQQISNFSPLRYIISIVRLVYLKGSNFTDIAPSLGAIIVFALFFNGWAVFSYRKTN